MSTRKDVLLTGRERTFDADEIIVSKTDTKGRITYVNDVFLTVSGYAEAEVLGKAHSIIRHPAMPRCVFKLLWDTISSGKEIFAYVLNRAKDGDHYWVFAHVTPTFGPSKDIVGYHSSRRVASAAATSAVSALYQALLTEEAGHADRNIGMQKATELLLKAVDEAGFDSYDQFIMSFSRA
jgi:PAS domain S-box-containing protein